MSAKVAVSPLSFKDQAITDLTDSGSSSGCDSSSGNGCTYNWQLCEYETYAK